MLKHFAAGGLAVALMIPAAASAAVLEKGAGSGCPEGQQGTFAFVVNQTTSTEAGTVTATFDSGRSPHSRRVLSDQEAEEYFVNAYGKLLGGARRSTASSFLIASGASPRRELNFSGTRNLG